MSRSSFRLKPRLHLKGLNESASPLLRRREISKSQAGSASSLNLGKIKDGIRYDNNDNNNNGESGDNNNNNDDDDDDGGVRNSGANARIIFNHLFEKESRSKVAVPLCELCKEPCSNDSSDVICDGGERWHPECFVCAQCFRPFQDGIFYEFEGRKYCEYDFQTLFAPCCAKCKSFITGRVIRAMKVSWHPDCFCCSICAKNLSDEGFVRLAGSPVCRECNLRERAACSGRHICYKCHQIIDEPHLLHKGETFHPYHFHCSSCNVELTASARETGGRLLCLRCHDKHGMPICGACRRPIEDRVVTALGKQWHVEHFVCAKCEKPFLGTRHYEKKGLAYCELHYHQLYGNICYSCNGIVTGDILTALNKSWCAEHFSCSFCDSILNRKSKFYELDLRPVCKNCYSRFPAELRTRLKRTHDLTKGSKRR